MKKEIVLKADKRYFITPFISMPILFLLILLWESVMNRAGMASINSLVTKTFELMIIVSVLLSILAMWKITTKVMEIRISSEKVIFPKGLKGKNSFMKNQIIKIYFALPWKYNFTRFMGQTALVRVIYKDKEEIGSAYQSVDEGFDGRQLMQVLSKMGYPVDETSFNEILKKSTKIPGNR